MFVYQTNRKMKNKITFKDALVDTINFYGSNLDARTDGCYFDGENRCAVGRFIAEGNEDFFREFDRIENNGVEAVIHGYQDKVRRDSNRIITSDEAARDLTVIGDVTMDDLLYLQIIHDGGENWTKGGLSDFGWEAIQGFWPNLFEEIKEMQLQHA